MMDKRILQLRKELDLIDEKILILLEKRMDIVIKVGQLKSELEIPIEDIKREKEIIKRLTEHSHKKLSDKQLIRIFKTFFQLSKNEQKKI
tara:strand:- start:10 stop:279 length:270 start_codon:yes stop_codon:yes gene_type:complete